MEKSEANSEGDNPRPWQSYYTVYTNAKAGMDGVDKEKVQRVVYEMSKGSKYFDNEKKKEAILKQKIDDMNARRTKLTSADMSHFQKVADQKILELEATRDLSRIWLHVDMDAFYAAVETLCNPSLKGKPMAVGGMSMISTANYEARKFGARAAMPGFIAKKLCSELVFVPTDFKKYTFYSDLTRKVFEKYDPHFMAASLDEAYLDITEVCRGSAISGEEVAAEIRKNVHKETGLTCSAGVAPNRLLAKVCSDINKPNGQFVLPNDRMAVMTFISSLPIRKIGGIGKVTESILTDALGIKTCEDMLQKGGLLCALFSRSTADFFLSVGLGVGGTDTPQVRCRKSISIERTFPATDDEALLFDKLADIAEMLCADMKKEGLSGRTLTLKLKTSSFEVRSRAVTLPRYICSKEDILKNASKLLKAELPASLRLMGLRMSHFNEETADAPSDPRQKTLINFIGSQSASLKNSAKQDAFGMDTSDFHLMDDTEPSFTTDSNDMCHHTSKKTLDMENPQDLEDYRCTSGDNLETETTHRPQSSNATEKANATVESEGYYEEPCQTGVSQLKHTESCSSGCLKRDYPSTSNNNVNSNKPMRTLPHQEQLCWIDDYKCSLCGAEMPPDFVEERTEHADFHLAEKLQKEESSTHSISPTPRMYPKNNIARGNKMKKQKPSPKQEKSRPIDMFFVKSNQNF